MEFMTRSLSVQMQTRFPDDFRTRKLVRDLGPW